MTISDYLKLRLDTANLDRKLEKSGFAPCHRRVADCMITIVAEKAQIASQPG